MSWLIMFCTQFLAHFVRGGIQRSQMIRTHWFHRFLKTFSQFVQTRQRNCDFPVQPDRKLKRFNKFGRGKYFLCFPKTTHYYTLNLIPIVCNKFWLIISYNCEISSLLVFSIVVLTILLHRMVSIYMSLKMLKGWRLIHCWLANVTFLDAKNLVI